MFDLRLDEEQQMLTDAIKRYAEQKVRKVFRDAEESGQMPDEVVRAGWEIGLLPTLIPEAYGGFGEPSTVTGALALEEFAWGDLALTFMLMTPNLLAAPVLLAGSEDQKQSYLPRLGADTPPPFTAALIEPVYQFDPRRLATTAVKDGNSYILNGVKRFTPLAQGAETILVYANEEGTTQGFLVPGDAEGLTIGPRDKMMGVRALPAYTVTLKDCRVSAENRLGGVAGCDFGRILNHSRVALGAAAVGVARAGFEYATDYAKQRVQFGEPIAHRQSIAFMIADMAADVDAMRLMVWEAAWQLDQGKDATRAVTVMKHYVDKTAISVADRALQILGGYGYIREYPVELWLRNARGFAAFDGLAII